MYGFLLALAVAAAIFFAGWWQGSSGKRELEHQIEAAVEKRRSDISDLTVYFSNRDTAAREQFALERGRDQLFITDLKAKVGTYVTPKADRACVVPRGFVLHHDAAWRGTPLPEAAGGSVDADSGIPLSRVAGVNTDNAGSCRSLRAEVLFWRKWYPDTQARWDAFARGTQGKPETLPATKGR